MTKLSWNEIQDRAVGKLYQNEPFATGAERVALLFEKYQNKTSTH